MKDKEYSQTDELIRKDVANFETILYIGSGEDQLVVAVPHDLDDFVKVGDQIKITITRLDL